MSEQPYEIELVELDCDSLYPNEYHLTMFATLTGLDRAEIWHRWPEKLRKERSWGGRMHVDAALALGFNTTPTFRKFDPETPWPCILRVRVPDAWGWKSCWWGLIYHQGNVYNIAASVVYEDQITYFTTGWRVASLAAFHLLYPGCRITSMLQVWMSTTHVLSEHHD